MEALEGRVLWCKHLSGSLQAPQRQLKAPWKLATTPKKAGGCMQGCQHQKATPGNMFEGRDNVTQERHIYIAFKSSIT